jgi:hypothetical protein
LCARARNVALMGRAATQVNLGLVPRMRCSGALARWGSADPGHIPRGFWVPGLRRTTSRFALRAAPRPGHEAFD